MSIAVIRSSFRAPSFCEDLEGCGDAHRFGTEMAVALLQSPVRIGVVRTSMHHLWLNRLPKHRQMHMHEHMHGMHVHVHAHVKSNLFIFL